MKQPRIYLTAIALFLLTACSFIAQADVKDKKTEPAIPVYEVVTKVEEEQFDGYHIKIQYPETPNSQINQAILDYTNLQISSFKQESYVALKEQKSEGDHRLQVDYEILHQDGYFFVVRFNETMTLGTGEPVVTTTVLNFEKGPGNMVATEDLFKKNSDYLQVLSQLANEKLPEGAEELQATKENFQNLAWTEEGLQLYVNGGNKEVVLLKGEAVGELLREEYRLLW